MAYHEGSGSLVCRLATREPRECVSWTSRWRDCSRALIWSGEGVDIFFFFFFLCSGCGSWLLGSSVVVKRRAEVEVEEIHRRAYIRALITDSR